MKITKSELKQIIKEEIEAMQKEQSMANQENSTTNSNKETAMNSEASSILANINAIASQVVQQQNTTKQNSQNIKEAGLAVGFSIALAVPKLLSLAGSFAKKFNKQEAADWFEHAGHKVHDAYISAIMKVLTLVPQFKKANPQIQKKISEMIFMGIVGIMLGASAIGAVEQLSSMSNLPLGVVEGILTAIKRNELRAYLIKEIATLLPAEVAV